MQSISLKRRDVDLKSLKKRSALESDCSIEITEPCVIRDENGEVVIIYGTLDEPALDLEWAFKSIKYQESTRTSGLKTRSRIFGFSPRNGLRNNFCSITSMATEHPKEHAVISYYGDVFSKVYMLLARKKYEHQAKLMERVKDRWKIPNTVFTSGIVNKITR